MPERFLFWSKLLKNKTNESSTVLIWTISYQKFINNFWKLSNLVGNELFWVNFCLYYFFLSINVVVHHYSFFHSIFSVPALTRFCSTDGTCSTCSAYKVFRSPVQNEHSSRYLIFPNTFDNKVTKGNSIKIYQTMLK